MDYYLSEDWKDITKVAVLGYGELAKNCIGFINRIFDICFIADNDIKKQGLHYNGIRIEAVEEVVDKLKWQKIIIMTVRRNAIEISKQLNSYGMQENVDFCVLEQFLTEWFWRFRRKTAILEIHTSITTRCTFKCKNCNMFMPCYINPEDFDVEKLKRNFDLLFQKIDYVVNYEILGGEPFLHKGLQEVLEYLYGTYGERIGRIGVITNGSILPSKETLECISKSDVEISISDYTEQVAYQPRMSMFVGLLEQYGIKYVIKKDLRWCDFGFPHQNFTFDESEAREHMLECGPVFHGVNDGRFYYCHVAWSAEKCGRWQNEATDYIDLEENISGEKIIAYSIGDIEKGYISLCRVCGGCGNDNKHFVIAGEQLDG